jgi:predicted Zn-dependent protease with MMP-like domain/predicted nucleotidyltransferase
VNNDNRLDVAVSDDYNGNVAVLLGYGDGSFSNERSYSTGSYSPLLSIAFGDFNNDSILDIVVANSNNNMIDVFLGFTYINGVSEGTLSTGSSPHPRGIALGDFNNDAQLDIIMANNGLDNVGVLLAYTNTTYSMQMMFSTGVLSLPTSVAIGDFNNDSELDITVANSGTENVGVLYGYGNGSFASPNTYSTGSGSIPQSVSVGDFNNDKRLDIAVADSGTDSVLALLRYDPGAFGNQTVYLTGTYSQPMSVAVGDFNNDSQLDFVVVNGGSDNIGVFRGLGNGTFSSQTPYSTGSGSYPFCTAVADFNKDSHLDIVVCNYWGSTIGIFLGFGNGTFSTQITYSTGNNSEPISIAVGDFNNDRQLDIVVVNNYYNNIGIFHGYGNGTFSSQTNFSTGTNSNTQSVAVADFNNDNRLDIVVANGWAYNIGIFYGYGDGTFSDIITYSTGSDSYPALVVVGDFNNDGRLDVAVANYGTDNIGVFFGNGNGNFSSQTNFSTGSGSKPYPLAVGDFNNDNQLDIAVANYGSNNLGVLLGCINGTFFSQLTYLTGDGSQPLSIAVGDFNNDSRLDVVVANSFTDNVGVFLGYASESFLSAPAYSTGFSSQPTSVAVGDFNNDTRLDIVVANNGTDNVTVLFGSGYGTFVSQATYSTGYGSYPCWVAVGDFNNDSRLDIVVANSGTNNVGVFLSNGTGTFSNQTRYSTGLGSQPYSVAVLDFDNDTRLDIAVANYGTNSLGVFLGYGNGSFASQLIFNTGFDSHPFALFVGDVNNDNLTDIVATNNEYGNVDILSKNC